MQDLTRRETITFFDGNHDSKSREFGKDITNAFVGLRKSLDQPIINKSIVDFGKQTKLGDFKNFAGDSKITLKKGVVNQSFSNNLVNPNQGINNINSSRFGVAPKQGNIIPNLKKTVRNQSSMIVSCNNFTKDTSVQMEIDSFSTHLNKEGKNEKPTKEFIPEQSNDSLNPITDFGHINFHKMNTIDYCSNVPSLSNLLLSNSTGYNLQSKIHERPNVQEVPEYIHSIFLHLKEFEKCNPDFYPLPGYMKRNQTDINEKMRAILNDWLIEVHLKFKLLPETFFLTMNIIDRYLNKKTIQRTSLQLVGITSMLIASKYEEIYAPEVKDFVFITDKAYTRQEVISMELEILNTLEYNLTMPSANRFVEMYHHFIGYNQLVLNFALYLLDLSIVEYKMLKYKGSLLAASVLYVASKLLHKESIIYNDSIEIDSAKLYELSEYSEEEIKECAKEVCLIYDYSDKTGLLGIKKKYSLPKFHEVAKLKFGSN